MVSRPLFENWLRRAVAFANLPAPVTAHAALRALRGPARIEVYLGGPKVRVGAGLGDAAPPRWRLPESGYAQLHAEWCGWCAEFIAAAQDTEERLRGRCLDWSMGAEGRDLVVLQSAHLAPFAFHERGAPQLAYVEPSGPEGLLALVGAELLAPGAAFGMRRCAGCGRFDLLPLVDRPAGRPWTKFCDDAECRKSTRRVRLHRAKQSKKRSRR